MKFCRICKTMKPETEFHKDVKAPDGLCRECKNCRIDIQLKYHKRTYTPRKKRTTCIKCGSPIQTGRLCNNCKKPPKKLSPPQRYCKTCGKPIPKGLSFCDDCKKIKRIKYNLEQPKTIKMWAHGCISHKKRNKKFNVTLTVEELTIKAENTKECPLCGCKLNYTEKRRKTTGCSPTIDRINNESIVSNDNIWILCHSCNSTKRNRTLQEFIEYCKKVANYQQK